MEEGFQFIDIIVCIGVSQGLFLAYALYRIHNNNKQANFILSLLIGISTIILAGRFIYYKYFNLFVLQTSLIVDSLIFLFGPLLYIYTRRLLFKENQNYRLQFFHWLPFLLMFSSSILYSLFYTKEAYYELILAGQLSLQFLLIELSMIVLSIYYLIRSFLLLGSYQRNKENSLSFEQSPMNYLYLFHFAVGTCFMFWLLIYIARHGFGQSSSLISYNTLWMIIPVFLFVIGYYNLRQPELFRIPLKQVKNTKKPRLSSEETAALKKRVDALMEVENIYLQSDLTLSDISKKLDTSRNNISWLLNNEYHLSFNEFINDFRIKAFLHKIENGEHLKHTLLAIATDVGFNSKSTFNKAFKQSMKDTPSNYIKKHHSNS